MSGTMLRLGFRFSGLGRYAVCLTAEGRRPLAPEMWDLTGARPRSRVLRSWDGESAASTAVPTDDGAVLLSRAGSGGTHRLLLVVPDRDGTGWSAHDLAAVTGGGLRLVAGRGAGTAALAFRTTPAGGTAVWRLSGRAEPPELVAGVLGPLAGGVWLDTSGRLLALAVPAGPRTRTVVLDLSDGAVAPLPGLERRERLLLAAPEAGVLLTARETRDGHRLGIRPRDADAPTVFPEELNAVEGAVTPLALDPAGRQLALAVTAGVRCRAVLYDLAEGGFREAGPATGTILPMAAWSAGGLRLVRSAPGLPPHVVTVPGPDGGGTGRADAAARRFDGPAGPVEAVVYGDPVAAGRVVLALHGGPESAWRLGHDPLFQRLADEGVAVVAPNQRGSTGYGPAHRDAIRGAWGGPDLADVLHLGRALTAARGPGADPPLLYGVSYGAHLALLASAAEPGLWSGAAVVAPFLSGRQLHADGPPLVRNMLDRLGGCAEIDDDLGPRDLIRLADRLRGPLLVVHGERDATIPVGHSRRLRDRLARAGPGGPELTYVEVPGAGHDPLTGPDGHLVLDRLVAFLRRRSPRRP
ncbi:alpha/beta hydrolase family protein [Nonomuraea sp. NPDC049655]|uniref:alpha/beta hydrolase family protein n=1 Tax=Nonomuraea sp. NPDC049655 TaxID=3364355 RepID=UPI0037B93CAF